MSEQTLGGTISSDVGVGHVEGGKMGRNLVVVNLERLKLSLGTIKTGHLREVVN